mgnify:CR=1 FL=1
MSGLLVSALALAWALAVQFGVGERRRDFSAVVGRAAREVREHRVEGEAAALFDDRLHRVRRRQERYAEVCRLDGVARRFRDGDPVRRERSGFV